MLSGELPSLRSRRRRWKALAVLGSAALALHASVLEQLAWSWRRPALAPNTPALQVRTLATEVMPALPVTEPARPLAEPAPPRPVAKRAVPPARPPADTPLALAPQQVPAVVRPEPVVPPPDPLAPAVQPVPAAPAPPPVEAMVSAASTASITPFASAATAASAAPVAQVPADRAQVPSSITLGYDLRRGLLRGSAELVWEAQAGAYTLTLEASVAGFSLLRQTSVGNIDDTGLAPLRFTDQRNGREVRAANFQREAGKITFSGPPVEFPWVAGTQDRLSLLIQLAAVVSADPRRREPGGQVVMAVVGGRGDLATWVFRYVGDETVDTGLGLVKAAKFVRVRADTYDADLEVWLDPARQHLPARAVQRAGSGEDPLELRLRQVGGALP